MPRAAQSGEKVFIPGCPEGSPCSKNKLAFSDSFKEFKMEAYMFSEL